MIWDEEGNEVKAGSGKRRQHLHSESWQASCRPFGATPAIRHASTTKSTTESEEQGLARLALLRGRRRVLTADGYYRILGRVDDVINVAGHRLGTKEVESPASRFRVPKRRRPGVDEVKGRVLSSTSH